MVGWDVLTMCFISCKMSWHRILCKVQPNNYQGLGKPSCNYFLIYIFVGSILSMESF